MNNQLQPARDLSEGEMRERRARALEQEAFLIEFNLDKSSMERSDSQRAYLRQLAQEKLNLAASLRKGSPQ